MKLLMENWRGYLNETGEAFEMPEEIYQGTGNDEEDAIFIKNIPMDTLTMLKSQGERIISHIQRGKLSMTEGLPLLWYDLDKKQLIVDDGNHRIFQKWLGGENTFDAEVYSSDYHNYLRSVYEGEETFDWDEEYRERL